ncbi:hypothetical protein AU210_001274 [Fusarium oxysporum f. sp. radicis-cucumerinum]|uniref:Uncharacterized protein n=1 Tax=Fusarium oxysporum f. sp. radicis-cucumerinum TaxID=327505 RepID=A0A2H3HVP6_FUSOX|nr:hypothetical protein AU210_001274 [Fusarium oxysporum f. sp. radicis-cucumerinum]
MVVKEFLDSDRVNFLVWRFVTTSRPRLAITAPSRLLAITFFPYRRTFLLTMNFCAPTDFFLKAIIERLLPNFKRSGTSSNLTGNSPLRPTSRAMHWFQ